MNCTPPQLRTHHLTERATYFISDLHLSDKTPHITESFIAFLKTVAPHADAIYILGDFLDAWIGDDTPADFLEPVITSCQSATKTTSLFYLHGNRDFLLSENLINQMGMTYLTDPSQKMIHGHRCVLCHGDHLCGDDKGHQFLRKFTLSRPIQKLFLHLPLFVRLSIARHLQTTDRAISINPKYDVTDRCVEDCALKQKAELLIHGHTHRPMVHHHKLSNRKQITRYVLGCWDTSALILRWVPNNQPALVRWSHVN